MANRKTSLSVAHKAAQVLNNPNATKTSKTPAGSVLSQAKGKGKK